MMVGFNFKASGFVTACAQRVPLGAQAAFVGIVTVATRDARRIHTALQERAVDVDLTLDLAIRVVEGFMQRGQTVTVR